MSYLSDLRSASNLLVTLHLLWDAKDVKEARSNICHTDNIWKRYTQQWEKYAWLVPDYLIWLVLDFELLKILRIINNEISLPNKMFTAK